MSAGQPQNREHLARYLDRIRSAYPYGVPTSVFRVETSSGVAPAGAPMVSFVVVQPEVALSPEQDVLLDSIVTKGLRISVDRTSRRVVRDEAELHVCIAEQSTDYGVIVVLGASRQDGNLELLGAAHVLYSHALSDISTSPAVKKAFWGHLQTVLGRLS